MADDRNCSGRYCWHGLATHTWATLKAHPIGDKSHRFASRKKFYLRVDDMKSRILNALLILTSLIGYLEWGSGNHTFLFQAEAELFRKLFSDPLSALHPLTVLPLVGQVILVFTLFQAVPGKQLTLIGMTFLAVLLLLMTFVGLLSLNPAIVGSTLPFLVVSTLTILHHRKKA